jgi:hypothetical protein
MKRKMSPRWIRKASSIVALVAFFAALLLACARPAREPPPMGADEYWASAGPLAQRLAEAIRLFSVNNAAIAQAQLDPGRYCQSIEALAPDIFDAGRRLVPLRPPVQWRRAHAALIRSSDLLVASVRLTREFRTTRRMVYLAQVFQQVQQAQQELENAARQATDRPEGMALAARLDELGAVLIDAQATPVYTVLVGPFASAVEARTVAERAGPPATATDRSPFLVRLAAFDQFGGAQAEADVWQERGVPARVEEESRFSFQVTWVRPARARVWREPVWQQPLSFPAMSVAASDTGDTVIVTAPDGSLQGWSINGVYQWHRKLDVPIHSVAMSGNGERLLLAGYTVSYHAKNGQNLWRAPDNTDGTLIVETQMSQDGTLMAARSANDSGEGRIFGLGLWGRLWRTRDDVGAQAMWVSPKGDLIAALSNRNGESFVVVYNPAGERVYQFPVLRNAQRIVLAPGGKHTAILTSTEVAWYENDGGKLVWRQPFRGQVLLPTGDGTRLVAAGRDGIAAFDLSGNRLWLAADWPITQLVVGGSYLAAVTEGVRVQVYRLDGTLLGEVTPLATVRSLAFAQQGRRLLVLDAEQKLTAWDLPA